MGRKMRVGGVVGWAAVSLLASLGACGDGDPDDSAVVTGGAGSTCGTAGDGGVGGGCATGAAGGAGATGGATSSSGGAGAGGAPPTCDPGNTAPPPDNPCLEAAVYASFFTLLDAELCVTAMHASGLPVGYSAVPSWGRHGGPLLVHPAEALDEVDLVRLTPPAEPRGAMTETTITVLTPGVPAGAFFGAQALDLPFHEWTAVSWTAATFDDGKLLLAHDAAVQASYASFPFAMAAVGAPCEPGRLLFTGVAPLGVTSIVDNALYAADSCGEIDADPHLVPEGAGRPDCEASKAIAAWGDNSGPVTADSAGNVVAVMTTPTDNEARGFAAGQVARGAPPAAGTPLFEVPGYGSTVAAMAPTATSQGFALFQATDSATSQPQNPIAQRYAISAGAMVAVGSPSVLLETTATGAETYLLNDDHDRIWVAMINPVGNATYFVLERAP